METPRRGQRSKVKIVDQQKVFATGMKFQKREAWTRQSPNLYGSYSPKVHDVHDFQTTLCYSVLHQADKHPFHQWSCTESQLKAAVD